MRHSTRASAHSETRRRRRGRARPTPDDAAGLFGPGSASWGVSCEAALLLGGPCALLMQLAHPAVAAGVADHSGFRADPFGRLRQTLETVYAIYFGDRAEALAAVARIDATHQRVRGVRQEIQGDKIAYDARDPALLLWVHATLVCTAVRTYRRYVGPFPARVRDRYYEESKVVARLLGVPDDAIPATYGALSAYLGDMIAHGPVAVGPTARDLAAAVLEPPIPLLPFPGVVFATTKMITADLLPPPLRRAYALPWNRTRRRLVDVFARSVRRMLPLLPDSVRWIPQARAAVARVRAAGAA